MFEMEPKINASEYDLNTCHFIFGVKWECPPLPYYDIPLGMLHQVHSSLCVLTYSIPTELIARACPFKGSGEQF